MKDLDRFVFIEGKDSCGGDATPDSRIRRNGKLHQAAERCFVNGWPAFNTLGFCKTTIEPQEEWNDLPSTANWEDWLQRACHLVDELGETYTYFRSTV